MLTSQNSINDAMRQSSMKESFTDDDDDDDATTSKSNKKEDSQFIQCLC